LTENRTQIWERFRRTAKYRALRLDYRFNATLVTPIEARDKDRVSIGHPCHIPARRKTHKNALAE